MFKYFIQQKLNLFLVFLAVFLLFACSQLSIPIGPIPITMQTVGVMLIALFFNRMQAISIILLYLVLGVFGAPVFANFQGGVQSLFGPSGGYLWGFLAAVIFMASLKKYLTNNSVWHIFLNCFFGTLVILILGTAWLSYFIGFKDAFYSGFYPFIVPGLIKALLAVVIFHFVLRNFEPSD